ncbi:uncharacterized protein LOC123516581 isoform X2 [Portunus trituberculatus]|uniref:uncharacterized protein LOC123516581 isoform X2 n=1 Tax=Portunus trituberculatus TaxID=210409 RepID=UPI001E1CCC1E|nr:uncharacterized protein LOC123516581 isoform X2 [Portunus trituberculatus]XP_045132036.1 uncharacterized protein LOC123516581 isoform X2 [Portunus trituberculatus]
MSGYRRRQAGRLGPEEEEEDQEEKKRRREKSDLSEVNLLSYFRCRTSHASPHSCDNAALMEFLAALPGLSLVIHGHFHGHGIHRRCMGGGQQQVEVLQCFTRRQTKFIVKQDCKRPVPFLQRRSAWVEVLQCFTRRQTRVYRGVRGRSYTSPAAVGEDESLLSIGRDASVLHLTAYIS